MLAVYFDELARQRRKGQSSPRGLQANGPHEVVVTEEEVDEDE